MDTKTVPETKIDAVVLDLCTDHKKQAEQVVKTKYPLSQLAPTVEDNDKQICALQTIIDKLLERVENAQRLSRCNNMQLVGILECMEGPRVVSGTLTVFNVVGLKGLQDIYIERVHRVTGKP
ncbi:hypothetical protein NDU88_007270 [Pleurodeles waltl]|uniref:Uncharacterized protein n=1 Tax=Pleurodeles waltl TaxID=8319 RepID=A0AAV7LST5_PLEWA|nr:hypothetical protein NDU88_007270 [Pleurodeles waltl]